MKCMRTSRFYHALPDNWKVWVWENKHGAPQSHFYQRKIFQYSDNSPLTILNFGLPRPYILVFLGIPLATQFLSLARWHFMAVSGRITLKCHKVVGLGFRSPVLARDLPLQTLVQDRLLAMLWRQDELETVNALLSVQSILPDPWFFPTCHEAETRHWRSRMGTETNENGLHTLSSLDWALLFTMGLFYIFVHGYSKGFGIIVR